MECLQKKKMTLKQWNLTLMGLYNHVLAIATAEPKLIAKLCPQKLKVFVVRRNGGLLFFFGSNSTQLQVHYSA